MNAYTDYVIRMSDQRLSELRREAAADRLANSVVRERRTLRRAALSLMSPARPQRAGQRAAVSAPATASAPHGLKVGATPAP